MKIDYIIPFVDMNDLNWRKVYEKHVAEYKNWTNCAHRFRDWNLLKYQLRSLEKHAPWINRIFIVLGVGGKTQIPSWLNTENEKIKIVYTDEYLPKEFLPTFNSNTIELFFPRIKELSEYYIASNDDYVVTKDLKPEDFFTEEGRVKVKMGLYKWDDSIYGKTIIRSGLFMSPGLVRVGEQYIAAPHCDHTLTPHLKSENLKMLETYGKAIKESCTRFRDEINFTWLIYVLNLHNRGLREKGVLVNKVYSLKTLEGIDNYDLESYDYIVINDNYDGDEYEQMFKKLTAKMDAVFPEKSSFEI